MTDAPPLSPISSMPAWLRGLGVLICFLPPLVYVMVLALNSDTTGEAVGGIVWTLVLGGIFFLVPLIMCLLPPLCWLLGWRPGALAGSVLFGLVGLRLSLNLNDYSVLGLVLGLPLDLHILLIGVLLWDWKQAAKRRGLQGPPAASTGS